MEKNKCKRIRQHKKVIQHYRKLLYGQHIKTRKELLFLLESRAVVTLFSQAGRIIFEKNLKKILIL